MFAIPFFTTPLRYSVDAYNSTCFEFPITKTICFLTTRLNKGSEEYDNAIKNLPGNSIKTKMQSFFDKMGIRKDLIVSEQLNIGFCSAKGTNFFTKGDAVIFLAPRFHEVDENACNWVIKHEISHIKNNDLFTMALVPAICSLAAAIISTFLMPVIPAVLITISVGIIAQAIFSHYREGKADDLAIAESSPEELKGGRRLLMAFTGGNRLNFLHPSTASRLKKIENALKQQNIKIDDQEESKKIAKLKKLIGDTSLELQNVMKRMGTLGLLMAMNQ